MAQTPQALFLPFGVGTCGGLGKSARIVIKRIVTVTKDQMQLLSSERSGRSQRSVVVAVLKGNAMILLAE
jgi:hypothetical protein